MQILLQENAIEHGLMTKIVVFYAKSLQIMLAISRLYVFGASM